MKTKMSFLFLWVLFSPYAYGQISWLSLDICSDYYLALFAQNEGHMALTHQAKNGYSLPVNLNENIQFHKNKREEIYRLKPKNIVYTALSINLVSSHLPPQDFSVQKWPWAQNKTDLTNFYQRLSEQFQNTEKWAELSPILEKPAYSPLPQKVALMGAGGFIVGRNTHYDLFFEQLAMGNYYEQSGYGKISLEKLISNPPDIIVTFGRNPKGYSLGEAFWDNPIWAKLNIPIIDISEFFMICPSHESFKAAEKVRKALS